jgi:hypothetical protein
MKMSDEKKSNERGPLGPITGEELAGFALFGALIVGAFVGGVLLGRAQRKALDASGTEEKEKSE